MANANPNSEVVQKAKPAAPKKVATKTVQNKKTQADNRRKAVQNRNKRIREDFPAVTPVSYNKLQETTESNAKHSAPSVKMKLKLYSTYAQNIYKRTERGIKQAFYQTDVLMPLYYQGQADLIQVMDQLFVVDIEKLQADLKGEIARLEAAAKSAGIESQSTTGVDYSSVQVYDVDITSPKQGMYLNLITEYDYYIRLMDSLWLYNVITTSVRSTQVFNWQGRIIKMANRCVHTQTSIRKALMNNTASQDRQKILKDIATSLGQEFFDKVFGKENKQ